MARVCLSLPACSVILNLIRAAVVLVAVSCRSANLPLWTPGQSSEPPLAVQCIRDIDYDDAVQCQPFRHQLDLFVPKGVKDFPVVVLFQGGGWMIGDNRCCGLYSSIGEFLASHGIAAVLPNYRQSPGVKHPAHVKDVARAVAWTHAHVSQYGGRVDQLFLLGHSAGGHLVALVAADDRYLKDEGLSTADIKGVIAVSGVYHIPPGKLDVRVGGNDPLSLRFDEVAPVRGDNPSPLAVGSGMRLKLNPFGPVFGNDPETREDASPIAHVHPGMPPFLLFNAERDLPMLPEMGEEFQLVLRQCGCEAELIRVPGRNHNSVMFMAIEDGDPVGRGILQFVRRHCAPAP
jgi:acetyl esterase/lipase